MRRVAVVVVVALVFPASVFAHASLVQESPSFRERVAASPREIVLRFDQAVTVLPGSIEVLRPDGKNLASTARVNGRALSARVPRLPTGPYTVRWKAVSNDGHVVSGVYTFGVRVAAPPPTLAVGAQGPTTTEHLVRWAFFLALALLVGGIGFRLLVAPRTLPPRAERRFYWTARFHKAGTEDFRAAMEQEAGRPLDRFFERWIYGSTLPKLKVGYRVEGTEVVLRVEQLGEIFDLPVTIALQYADRKSIDVLIPVTDQIVEQRVPLAGVLRGIDVSKDDGTLAEVVKN